MQFKRRFTTSGDNPFAALEFRFAASEIRNPDGTVVFQAENVEVPVQFSQVATDIMAQKYFRKAGVPVVDVGWTPDIPSVMANTQRIADELGESERGAAVNAQMQQRLGNLRQRTDGQVALYMTPAGVTTGPGSLIHEMIEAAGLTNMQTEPGWRSIPLERLAYEKPDLVAAAFFGSRTNHPDAWSPMKHPVARTQLTKSEVVSLEGAWTSCSGWFLMDAVEAMAEGTER